MKNMLKSIHFLVLTKVRKVLGISHSTKEMPYEEYLTLQREKTEDKERRQKWLGPEYESKVTTFREYFQQIIPKFINTDQSILCVCARTGQEVVALKDLGYSNSIGVDLVPCEPNVIFGDMHNLPFGSDSFSMVFSNNFDHSLYPLKFLEEVHRVLKPKGIFFLHVLSNRPNDKFGVTDIHSLRAVRKLFKGFCIVQETNIELFSLNHEFILKKI